MTSSDDPNRPQPNRPAGGFADDDEDTGRYVPVFAEGSTSTPPPGFPPVPVFADEEPDPDANTADPAPAVDPGMPPTPVFADEDDHDLPQPEPSEAAPESAEQGPGTPTPVMRLDGDLPGPAAPEPAAVPAPEQRDTASAPAAEPTETPAADDDDLGFGDDFFAGLDAPGHDVGDDLGESSVPTPRGLPTLGGISAREITDVDDFLGDDEPDAAPTTGSLWASDDIAVIGPPVESPNFASEVDPTFDDEPDAEGSAAPLAVEPEEIPGYVPDESYMTSDPVGEESYDYPPPASSTEPNGGYITESVPDDSEVGSPTGDLGESEYADDYNYDYDYDEEAYGYDEANQPALNQDDLVVTDDGPRTLRDRSRTKGKKNSRSRDKADAKLAKENGEKKGTSWKVLAGVAVAVIGAGFAAQKMSSSDEKDDKSAAPAAAASSAPPSGNQEPGTPGGSGGADACMTAPEVAGTPVACSAEGNQQTGTNAILAYEHAFYGARDADRVYSLTFKGSEGGAEAENAKKSLKRDISGTPCGSTYVVTVTPVTPGQQYDVTIMVTSPPGDPMPSPDGVCPTGLEVSSEDADSTTRTLTQSVAVDGDPGSYTVRSIQTKGDK